MVPSVEEQAVKFQERRLSDYVYALLDEENPDVELVFFHGLQMEASNPSHAFWRTWKMRNSEECWPEWLLPQLLSNHKIKPRVLSVSYEARPDLSTLNIGSDCTDEYLISECLLRDLILGSNGVGQRANVPVFLLGHDLGGTLIKQFVMLVEGRAATCTEGDGEQQAKLNNFLERFKSVFFYATPHCGSEILGGLVPAEDSNLQNANQMLRLLQVLNKETARINQDFAEYRSRGQSRTKRSRFTTHAVHPTHMTRMQGGDYVEVVKEGGDRSDIDDYYPAPADHFSVCQPEGPQYTPLQFLVSEIQSKVQEARK